MASEGLERSDNSAAGGLDRGDMAHNGIRRPRGESLLLRYSSAHSLPSHHVPPSDRNYVSQFHVRRSLALRENRLDE